MKEIEQAIEELNNLPKGYISKKKIHGKTYSYLQFTEGKALKSMYLREDEVPFIYAGLARRKELEKKMENFENEGRDLREPSKRSRDLTGSLMAGDREAARFEHGKMIMCNEELAPLFIVRTGNISAFLASRAIDRGRTNSRILKKALGIKENEDDMLSLYSFGATVTDDYWFRAKGSKLKYSDISFTNDCYSDIALKGEILVFPKYPKHTPQLTLVGSYEKCWKRENGRWFLWKAGNEDEIFSELFCSRLAEALGIPTVSYEEAESGYIKTENFADRYNFEPMTAVAGEDDSYDSVFDELLGINEGFAKQYLLLIWFDTLVNNVDRHNENCGFLRDKTTGELISLAPNFDNNLALISRTKMLNTDPETDGFMSFFVKFIRTNKKAAELFKTIPLPEVNENTVQSVLDSITIKRDEKMLMRYILKRTEYMKMLQE